MGSAGVTRVDVVELNPHWPRPFVFTEAAICLRDSLRAAGYASDLRVNSPDCGSLAIVLAEPRTLLAWAPHLDPCRTLPFNFEQLGSDSALIGPEYLGLLRRFVTLDYHGANLAWLGGTGRAFELPVVPSASLAFPSGGEQHAPAPIDVDVLFFGTPNGRRAAVLEALRRRGLRVEVVSGAYAWELTPVLSRARVVLHVHFYESALFPAARVLQPMASGVPVVCERSVLPQACDWTRSGIDFAALDDLPAACAELLGDPSARLDAVRRSRRFVARMPFADRIACALQALRSAA